MEIARRWERTPLACRQKNPGAKRPAVKITFRSGSLPIATRAGKQGRVREGDFKLNSDARNVPTRTLREDNRLKVRG